MAVTGDRATGINSMPTTKPTLQTSARPAGPTLFDFDGPDAEAMFLSCPVSNDESQTEDLIICRTSAAVPESIQNESHTTDPIATPPSRPPRKIGHGKLVNNRLSWKPGDPFGQSAIATTHPFAWERMMKSAALTAVSGLVFVWLLKALFA